MNRKRKSIDVLAQLGEPLPLPYRPSSIVKEEVEEIEPEVQPRRRHVPLFTRERDEAVPLPLWRARPEEELETNTQTILDVIIHKIEELRAVTGDDDENALKLIEKQLDEMLKKKEDSLAEELKRLQEVAGTEGEKSGGSRTLSILELTVLLVALLVIVGYVSYTLGGMSYDYCYYNC